MQIINLPDTGIRTKNYSTLIKERSFFDHVANSEVFKEVKISKKGKNWIDRKWKGITAKKEALQKHYSDNMILYCSYCGINQLQFIEKAKTRAKYNTNYAFQVDHFLSKAKYPQFAFDPYNLIPVCYFCNSASLKHNRDILEEVTNKGTKEGNIFHPYFGWLKIIPQSGGGYIINIINDDIDSFDTVVSSKQDGDYSNIVWSKNSSSTIDPSDHIRFFRLDHLYSGSPYIAHDVKYMHTKYNEIKEGRHCVAKLLHKTTDSVDRLTKNWAPDSGNELLSVPNGKFRLDMKEWMKDHLT